MRIEGFHFGTVLRYLNFNPPNMVKLPKTYPTSEVSLYHVLHPLPA